MLLELRGRLGWMAALAVLDILQMGGGQQPTRATRREDRAQVRERLRQVKATTRLRPTDRKPNEPGLNPTARR